MTKPGASSVIGKVKLEITTSTKQSPHGKTLEKCLPCWPVDSEVEAIECRVRQAFATRQQTDREDWMQYLDALEGLRSQGFPEDPVTTRRHEILQRFIEGVRDEGDSLTTGVNYVSETTVTDPPTVDSLQFTTRQLQRTRAKSAQPYDPRYAMRSRPHPFVPLPPNKLVARQGVFPPPPANIAPVNQAAASPAARLPLERLFQLWPNRSFCSRLPYPRSRS